MNPTLEGNLFVKLDCERVKINLRSTTLSSPSVTYICHRGESVRGEVCDIVGCDVIDIGTEVSGVYRSNLNNYHRHNFRPNSGAINFSDEENRSIIRLINSKSHLVYTRIQATDTLRYQDNDTCSSCV
jgi:hypothetical protein